MQLPEEGVDELRAVSHTFNQMTESLALLDSERIFASSNIALPALVRSFIVIVVIIS